MASAKPKSRLGSAFERFLRRVPKQSRSRALVSAILQAVDEQLASGAELDELTVERVSDRAGVGVGSFYEYFAGKDSLLGALIGHVTEQNFVELAARLDRVEGDDIEELIAVFSRDVAEAYLAHPKRMRVVVRAIGRLGLLPVVNRERDRFAEVMLARVRRALPNDDEDRLRRTMRLLADGAMGIMVASADRDPPDAAEAVADDLIDLAVGLFRRRHPGVMQADG